MFWRNEDSRGFAAAQADDALACWYGEVRHSGNRLLAAAVADFLSLLKHGAVSRHWLPQELSIEAPLAKASFVQQGAERPLLGSTVGAGVSLWVEAGERLHGEVGGYLHRLACTNGMISISDARGRIEADSASSWSRQLGYFLPPLLRDVEAGLELLRAACRVDLGLSRNSLPRLLAAWSADEPTRRLIVRAFGIEPGETLADLVNALSRAANLTVEGAPMSDRAALYRRHALQKAALWVCHAPRVQGGGLGDPFRCLCARRAPTAPVGEARCITAPPNLLAYERRR